MKYTRVQERRRSLIAGVGYAGAAGRVAGVAFALVALATHCGIAVAEQREVGAHGAASGGARPHDTTAPPYDASVVPVYNPPPRGAPARTVGGGTRGGASRADAAPPALIVLAPDHVGLTTRAQPSLFFYVANPGDRVAEFALTLANRPEPIVEKRLPGAASDGIHEISLAEIGVTLEPELVYEWAVALIADPNERSKDIVTKGAIQRVAEPASLRGGVKGSSHAAAARAFAAAGIWYDALAEASAAIAIAPRDPTPVSDRAALLDQADLDDVASVERRRLESAAR